MKTRKHFPLLWLAISALLLLSPYQQVSARSAVTTLPKDAIHAARAYTAVKTAVQDPPLPEELHPLGDTQQQKVVENEQNGEEYSEEDDEYSEEYADQTQSMHWNNLLLAFLRTVFLPETLIGLWLLVAAVSVRLVHTHVRRFVYPAIQKCYARLAFFLLATATASTLAALGWLQHTPALPVLAAGNAFLAGYAVHLLYYALPVLYLGGETQAIQILEVALDNRLPETAHYPASLRLRAGDSLFGCKAATCLALYMGGLLQVTHLVLSRVMPHADGTSRLRLWVGVACLLIETCACLLAVARGTALWEGLAPYCAHLKLANKKLLLVPFAALRAVQQVVCVFVMGDSELGMRMCGGLYLLETCLVAALALWELSADTDSLLTLLPPHHPLPLPPNPALSISGEPCGAPAPPAACEAPGVFGKALALLAVHDTLPGIGCLSADPQVSERVRAVLRHHEALSRGLLRTSKSNAGGDKETPSPGECEETTCSFGGRAVGLILSVFCLGGCFRRRTKRPSISRNANPSVELIHGTATPKHTPDAHTKPASGGVGGVAWKSAGSYVYESCTYFISEFWTRRKFDLDATLDLETGDVSETRRLLESPVEHAHEETETASPLETCACAREDTGDARSDSTGSGTGSDTENDH